MVSVSQLKVILVPVPFVLPLLFGTRYLILSGLLIYLPLNVLSKLTIFSLPSTHLSASRPHQRVRFYFNF